MGRFRKLVLLLDNLVNLGQIVLSFSSVAIFGEFSSGGHFFDIMFKFPNGWPRYFILPLASTVVCGAVGY